MDFLYSLFSGTNHTSALAEKFIDKHLTGFGIDQTDFLNEVQYLQLFAKEANVRSSDLLIRHSYFTKKEEKQKIGQIATFLQDIFPILSKSPTRLTPQLLRKFRMFVLKLSALYGNEEHIRKQLKSSKMKIEDLPTFDQALEQAEDNLLNLRSNVVGPINRGYTREYFNAYTRIKSEELILDDDVAYDHSLISRNPYYDASYIRLKERSYIGLHYPREDTLREFFSLLIANKVKNILCLKEPYESGILTKGTGFCYWPSRVSEKKEYSWGSVSLCSEQHYHHKSKIEYISKRRLLVQLNEGELSRTFVQYHYRCWEDGGFPDLEVFSELVNLLGPLSDSHLAPVAVHCHAGVGRTGVFVLTHSLYCRLHKKLQEKRINNNNNNNNNNGPLEVNIYKSLVRLRLQRESIQTPGQIAFVIAAVKKLGYQLQHLPLSPSLEIPPVKRTVTLLDFQHRMTCVQHQKTNNDVTTTDEAKRYEWSLADYERLFRELPEGICAEELISRLGKMTARVLEGVVPLMKTGRNFAELDSEFRGRSKDLHVASPRREHEHDRDSTSTAKVSAISSEEAESCRLCGILHVIFSGSRDLSSIT
eukprot:TRINITY_DN1014_c0_g1_i1.p1 TRINITY_DN1014_c0_g1~~TRINITY_DN1014_c0_g1_i1.p1  ORF type:complete len:599 (-),score=128.57 TRINITY_DN1014_c0_g1_i1:35-1804(-)